MKPVKSGKNFQQMGRPLMIRCIFGERLFSESPMSRVNLKDSNQSVIRPEQVRANSDVALAVNFFVI